MLAVGTKQSRHPEVYAILGSRRPVRGACILWSLHAHLSPYEARFKGVGFLRDLLRTKASGDSVSKRLRGRENFAYPGSHHLLELVPRKAEILHFHNLHGGFFDLRFLSTLSRQVATVLTLHDAWLLSGHCAHSFDCDRWLTGCGQCPDLNIYPSLLRDGTAANWLEKRNIYRESRLLVATPSRWLMHKVERSMLDPVDARVIPNGINLTNFQPGNKNAAQAALGVQHSAAVLLYVGACSLSDSFKDFATLKAVALALAEISTKEIALFCVGGETRVEHYNRLTIYYRQSELSERELAVYYQAADVYVHAAKAENYPYVIMESLACGCPVVASNVGGIAEQIIEGTTGYLVQAGDVQAFVERILNILNHPALRQAMSVASIEDAHRRFGLNEQVSKYLGWYSSILAEFSTP